MSTPRPTEADVEALSARLHLADRRTSSRDSWEMLANHQQKPYRAMAHAARDYFAARDAEHQREVEALRAEVEILRALLPTEDDQ